MWSAFTNQLPFGHRPSPHLAAPSPQFPHSSSFRPSSAASHQLPNQQSYQTEALAPSFTNEISPFPPSQYSSPPTGTSPQVDHRASFFTAQPRRVGQAEAKLVRTFGALPPIDNNIAREQTPIFPDQQMPPPSQPGRPALAAAFVPTAPPHSNLTTQNVHGVRAVDSYYPPVNRAATPAALPAQTPNVSGRALRTDEGRPRTAAEVYMASTQIKTTMGDRIMGAIEGLQQTIATFGPHFESISQRLEGISTQHRSTNDVIQAQKDDLRTLREGVHDLQVGQRALGTLEEIREEIAGQVGPALGDFEEALESKIDDAVRDVPDFKRMLEEHLLGDLQDQHQEKSTTSGAQLEHSSISQILSLLERLQSVDLNGLSDIPTLIHEVTEARAAIVSSHATIDDSPASAHVMATLGQIRDELQVQQSLAHEARLGPVLIMVDQLLASASAMTPTTAPLVTGNRVAGSVAAPITTIQPWPTPCTPSLLDAAIDIPPPAFAAPAVSSNDKKKTQNPAGQTPSKQLTDIARRFKRHFTAMLNVLDRVPSTQMEVAMHVAGIKDVLDTLEEATGAFFSMQRTGKLKDAAYAKDDQLVPGLAMQDATANRELENQQPTRRSLRLNPELACSPTPSPQSDQPPNVVATADHGAPSLGARVVSHDVFGPEVPILQQEVEIPFSQTQRNTQSQRSTGSHRRSPAIAAPLRSKDGKPIPDSITAVTTRKSPSAPFQPIIQTRSQRASAERQSQVQSRTATILTKEVQRKEVLVNAKAAEEGGGFTSNRINSSSSASRYPPQPADHPVAKPQNTRTKNTRLPKTSGNTQAEAIEVSSSSDTQRSDISLGPIRPLAKAASIAVKKTASPAVAPARPMFRQRDDLKSKPKTASVSKKGTLPPNQKPTTRAQTTFKTLSAQAQSAESPRAASPTCESQALPPISGNDGSGSLYENPQNINSPAARRLSQQPAEPFSLIQDTLAPADRPLGAGYLGRNDSRQYGSKRKRVGGNAPSGLAAKRGRFETLQSATQSDNESECRGGGAKGGSGLGAGKITQGRRMLWDSQDELDLEDEDDQQV